MGGYRVSNGGRKIKRIDREVHLNRRNVNHKAVSNYEWTWMLPNRGIPRRQHWVALQTGDTHTQLEGLVKHVNESYSGLGCGCLFTTTEKQTAPLSRRSPKFLPDCSRFNSQPDCVKPVLWLSLLLFNNSGLLHDMLYLMQRKTASKRQ